MLGQRLRRWPNIKTALGKWLFYLEIEIHVAAEASITFPEHDHIIADAVMLLFK